MLHLFISSLVFNKKWIDDLTFHVRENKHVSKLKPETKSGVKRNLKEQAIVSTSSQERTKLTFQTPIWNNKNKLDKI